MKIGRLIRTAGNFLATLGLTAKEWASILKIQSVFSKCTTIPIINFVRHTRQNLFFQRYAAWIFSKDVPISERKRDFRQWATSTLRRILLYGGALSVRVALLTPGATKMSLCWIPSIGSVSLKASSSRAAWWSMMLGRGRMHKVTDSRVVASKTQSTIEIQNCTFAI